MELEPLRRPGAAPEHHHRCRSTSSRCVRTLHGRRSRPGADGFSGGGEYVVGRPCSHILRRLHRQAWARPRTAADRVHGADTACNLRPRSSLRHRRGRVPASLHGQGREVHEQTFLFSRNPSGPESRDACRLCAPGGDPGYGACPPYHLAFVIGGLGRVRPEDRQTRLGRLPGRSAHARRRGRPRLPGPALEAEALEIRATSVGDQFGGSGPAWRRGDPAAAARRLLPRRPRGELQCGPQRQGQDHAPGDFLEQLETDPARYLPSVSWRRPRRSRSTSTGRWPRSAPS